MYEPELGQRIYGQPYKSYVCPDYIEELLRGINAELRRVMWNLHQKEYDSPFDNTGNSFKNEVFEVIAYSWDEEEEQPYNFKWRDVEISWYKYCGRGMSMNQQITTDKAIEMFDSCIQYLHWLRDTLVLN